MSQPNFYLIFEEVNFTAVRSRGPGGQNVNKVSSAALLKWSYNDSKHLSYEQKSLVNTRLKNIINKEGELFLRSDEYRDLERNKAKCLEKLEDFLTTALHKDKPRRKTRPTYSSKKKRLESKTHKGKVKTLRKKPDY